MLSSRSGSDTGQRKSVKPTKGQLWRETKGWSDILTTTRRGPLQLLMEQKKNKTNKQKNNNNPKSNLLRSEFLKYQNECEVCGEIIILLKLLLLKVLHKADIDPLKNTNTHSNLNRADNKKQLYYRSILF